MAQPSAVPFIIGIMISEKPSPERKVARQGRDGRNLRVLGISNIKSTAFSLSQHTLTAPSRR